MSSKSSTDLSKREKFLIAALFIAMLSTCLLKLGGLTTFGTIYNLYLEQVQIRAEIEQLDAVIANEQQLEAGYLEARSDCQFYQQLIPTANQQPASIGAIEKLISSGPGRLLSMRVSESIDYGDYSAHCISI